MRKRSLLVREITYKIGQWAIISLSNPRPCLPLSASSLKSIALLAGDKMSNSGTLGTRDDSGMNSFHATQNELNHYRLNNGRRGVAGEIYAADSRCRECTVRISSISNASVSSSVSVCAVDSRKLLRPRRYRSQRLTRKSNGRFEVNESALFFRASNGSVTGCFVRVSRVRGY